MKMTNTEIPFTNALTIAISTHTDTTQHYTQTYIVGSVDWGNAHTHTTTGFALPWATKLEPCHLSAARRSFIKPNRCQCVAC